MKNLLLLALPVCMFMTVTSCGPSAAEKAKQDSLAAEHVKDSMRTNIESAEKVLKSNPNSGAKEVNTAIKAYTDFANKYPSDTMTPEYLLRASTRFSAIGNFSQSVALLETIIDQHKDFKRYDDALWLAANIYAEYLPTVNHGDERAKELYSFIIARYPGSNYAVQSAELIKYIGVPADSLYNAVVPDKDKGK
jgi:TolA-binding protein